MKTVHWQNRTSGWKQLKIYNTLTLLMCVGEPVSLYPLSISCHVGLTATQDGVSVFVLDYNLGLLKHKI